MTLLAKSAPLNHKQPKSSGQSSPSEQTESGLGIGPKVRSGSGRAQLTIVEHALCPLVAGPSHSGLIKHRSEFHYQDQNRHQKTAVAEVTALDGLSPNDEFFLWGLLHLTLRQPEPLIDFYATPIYCLTELGVVERSIRGGKSYETFRGALARLAGVTYTSEHFYDPVRGEHRSVRFGFLSYSLPPKGSRRAWRIAWDPIFFEFCRAIGGGLIFDLETYRKLDFASRRLYLLLKKIFWRQSQSPAFDLHHLGVNILGFAPTLDVRDLKVKITRVANALESEGIITFGGSGKAHFEKRAVGCYTIRFQKGLNFDARSPGKSTQPAEQLEASPLYEPLRVIGLDNAAIERVIRTYKCHQIQEWADITLAAIERKGQGFFKVGPQAYFIDNLGKAAAGQRSAPDWWLEFRKEEERQERVAQRIVGAKHEPQTSGSEVDSTEEDRAFERYLQGEGKASLIEMIEGLTRQYSMTGKNPREISLLAFATARTHLRNRFRVEHPSSTVEGPQTLGELMKKLKLR